MKFSTRKQLKHCLWRSLLLFTFFSIPLLSHAQQSGTLLSKKITVQLVGESLPEALHKIEKIAALEFAFDSKSISTWKVPVAIYTDKSLEQILKNIFQNTPVTFHEMNGYIIISKNASKTPAGKNVVTGMVTGVITDVQTGVPLSNATITFTGKNRSIVSDKDGRFKISLAPGTYTATVSYIGFRLKTTEAVIVKEGETITLNIALEASQDAMDAVVVRADRVITSTDKQLIKTIRNATGVVSGISSQQISISVDRSASEVAQRVAGITLKDGFISIRGMTPRYNPVYLNNVYLPSTDPNKRAFNFDLLPSNVIDNIMVYKTPAPELPADFAGGVVKVHTKNSVPVKRLEISVNGQYRTGNKFFDNHASSVNGKYDWLGIDDGTRAIPASLPRNQYGEIVLPALNNSPDAYYVPNEVITQALLRRTAKSSNIQQVYHPVDIMADITNYTYANIGKMKLNSITVARYELQRTHFRSNSAFSANRFEGTSMPAPGDTLKPYYNDDYRLSYDSIYTESVRLAAMQQLSLTINKNHELRAMALINRNTQDALQINTQTNWNAESGSDVFPLRIEAAYNLQEVKLAGLGGRHAINNNRHELEWNASYSDASNYDPNQFSNVYMPDPESIKGGLAGPGELIITDSTTWQYNTFTRRNATVGRFVDGEGNESRKQGNIDYILKPFTTWKDMSLKAGAYYEYRKKTYRFSSLAFKDFPSMPFAKEPWLDAGATLLRLSNEASRKMHVGIQSAGSAELSGYDALFENIAGYLAANLPLRFNAPFSRKKHWQLNIYGGMRLEYSHRAVQTSSGEVIRYELAPDGQGGFVQIAEATAPYQHFWLPSVNATLHLSPQWQLRMAYGKTLNRPELRELSPFVTYKPTDGFTYIGQPTLHDARVDNYDLRAEWYPSPEEAVSLGLYHKHIKEPIEDISRDLNVGVPGYGPANLQYAKIWGMELELRKSLQFLPGNVFRYMGLIVNASYNITQTNNTRPSIDDIGKVNYYPGGTTRPFQGAAPWIVNAGLFYDNAAGGTRVSLQYNAMGDRLLFNTGSRIDNEPWAFERTRHLLDVSVLQKLTSWVSVRLAAQNLLNAPIRWYADADFNKHYNSEPSLVTYGTWQPGGRISYSSFIQGDYYLRNYRPGVYYTLGFLFNVNFKSPSAQK